MSVKNTPSPAFAAPGVSMHHGDCLRLLPEIVPPEGGFDALITDPPYSSGGRTAAERRVSPAQKYVNGGARAAAHNVDFAGEMMDARCWANWCAHWLEMARGKVRPGGYALVFTDWRQLPALTDAIQVAGWHWRGIAAWDKGAGARGPHKGYLKHQCEYIVWASNGALPAATHGRPWPGCYKVPVVPQHKLHMTGKPVPLMRELVSIVPPGSHILDPFAGSASTGVACIETGRRFTGVEVAQHYYDVSLERLKAAIQAQQASDQG